MIRCIQAVKGVPNKSCLKEQIGKIDDISITIQETSEENKMIRVTIYITKIQKKERILSPQLE